jgi:DNA repair exonuclease SbcCD ATPase subunit
MSGGWKQLLGKAMRVLRIPVKLGRFAEGAAEQYCTLRDGNVALYKLLSDWLPRLHQDVRTSREEIALHLQATADESRAEVRKLNNRYAEFYGALVEQLQEQNRRLDRLERQLQMAPPGSQLPRAG